MSDVALSDGNAVVGLAERVAVVESKVAAEERSWMRRSSLVGSMLALLISILSGGYSIYDNAVVRPSKAQEESLGELRQIVSRLSEINWKLIEQWSGDPQRARLVQMAANGEKVSLLDRADQIVAAMGPRIGLSEYLTLAYEHLGFGDNLTALRYANAAIGVAATPGLKAEAYRYKARALFMPGPTQDLEKGREAFREGLEAASGGGTMSASNAAATIYVDWLYNEASFGDCARLAPLLDEIEQALTSLSTSVEAPAVLQMGLQTLQQQKRCTVPTP
jgi:hypothetical protein